VDTCTFDAGSDVIYVTLTEHLPDVLALDAAIVYIFVDADSGLLLVNTELDPQRYFTEYSSEPERPNPDLSFADIQNRAGCSVRSHRRSHR